jgi:RNA polymerase sigma-70 factor (ECF subfamily)
LAEDAVQEVDVKWLSKFRALQGDQALRSWLYQTTANQCKDFLRKSKRNVHLFKRLKEKSMLRNGENPETILLNQAKDKHLADRVLLLPIIYREVVILYYYEDYSTLQIAEILNIKPSTVNTRLARARALLKDRLGDEDFEE